MANQPWEDGFLENRGWTGIVQRNATTGALEFNGEPITGTIPVTIAQFLVLDPADYIGAELWIEDIPVAHSLYNGVAVRANAAGTGWIWMQTPSFTKTTVPTAAQASGWKIFVSDIGNRGGYFFSNGTRYLAKDRVTFSHLTSDIVLTGSPTAIKVMRQVAIPTLDGKSIWNNGDILEVRQLVEKTGTTELMTTYMYMGTNALVLDDTETNTSISGGMTTAANANLVMGTTHWIRRDDSTHVRLLSGANQISDFTISSAKSTQFTVTNLDTTVTYIDAASKFASGTDSALTLVSHIITLIPAGAA